MFKVYWGVRYPQLSRRLATSSLIFAILQWALPEFKLTAKEKEWDPHSLKAISQPDKIKRGELITEIFFTSGWR